MKKSILAILAVLLLVGLFAFSAFGEETTVEFKPYEDPTTLVRQYCACGNKFVADVEGTVKYVNGEDGCKNHKDENGNVIDGCDGTLIKWSPCDYNLSSSNESAYTVAEDGTVSGMAFYLTANIKSGSQQFGTDAGNYYLDLNGHSFTRNNARVITPQTGINLYITDTSAEKDGYIASVDTDDSPYAGQGVTIWFRYADCSLTLFDGTIDGTQEDVSHGTGGAAICNTNNNTISQFGGTIKSGTSTTARGGFVVTSGTYNLYDGDVVGGTAINGGALYIGSNATINIYDGTITGGTSTNSGGTIYNIGTLNIYGGTIGKGKTGKDGGALYIGSGSLTMTGGTITGGTATNGGNIRLAGGSATFSGGTVSCGYASNEGGNLRANGGTTVTINGTAVFDGKDAEGNYPDAGVNAVKGGNIYSYGTMSVSGNAQIRNGNASDSGGNIYNNVSSGSTLTISETAQVLAGQAVNAGGNIYNVGNLDVTGGSVSHGVVTNGGGGNLLAGDGAVVTISGGTFSYGNTSAQGGSIRTEDGSTLTISGGTFEYGGINAASAETTTTQGGNLAALGGTVTVNGGTFDGGRSTEYGGNIRAAVAVTLGENVVLKNGYSYNGGNISNNSGGNITVNGATIKDGTASNEGGNVYNYSGKTFTMNSGLIENGKAKNGGNVLNGGTFNMLGGQILDGTATGRGGNVQSFRGNGTGFTMEGGTVSGGKASYGGNFYVAGVTDDERFGMLTMNGGTIENGEATGTQGGNISVGAQGKVIINAGNVTGGTAKTTGGNIHVGSQQAVIQLNGGTVSGGTAANGGNLYAIASVPAESMTVGTVTIASGIATENGGNCYILNTCTFNGTTLTGGEAVNGGSIYTNGELTLTGCTLSGAHASGCGGAVYVEDGSLTITDGILSCTGTRGGNLYVEAGTAVCSNCRITGGTATNAAYAYVNGGSLALTDCTLTGGSATSNGGGFFVNTDAALSISGGSITNVTSGASGGVIFAYLDAQVELDNVTISGISAAAKGGAVFNAGTMTITGGSITGGQGALGGNIYTKDSLTLSNVTIDDGVATGGITVAEDGTVSGGDKTYGGGNIYLEAGELNIQEGTTISDGTTYFTNGGNIYADAGTINMTGGTISGGDAKTNNKNTSNDQKHGGNVALMGEVTFDISGGTVTGGYAHEGGNFRVSNAATLNISGDALITLGSAANGGNINSYGVVNMQGGTISDGTATNNGGNAQCFRSTTSRIAVFTMTGGTISGGTANCGGNVYAAGYSGKTGYFVMNAGTVTGGTASYGKDIYVNNLGNVTVNGGTANDVYLAGHATDVGGTLTLAGDPTIESLYISNVNNFTVDASDLACTTAIPLTVPQLGVFADSAVDTSDYFSCEAEYEVYYDTAAQKLYVRYPVVQDVYVSATGDDLAAGDETNPVQTFARALNIVADGGTIHLVGVVEVSGWDAHDKSMTVTGDEMNVTKGNPFYIRDSVHFKNMTMRFSTVTADDSTNGKHRIYALGNKVIIDEDVTVKYGADGSGVTGQYVYLFGGGNDSNVVGSTDLTVLSGTWGRIFGGSNGSDISGDVHLTVGGNVNQGVDYVSHDYASYYLIHGGSSAGNIGGTVYMNVTGGTHTSTHGGSIGSSSATYTIGNIEMHVTGGEGMAIYGGGRGGLNKVTGEANVYIEGGYYEQVFGGGLNSFEGTLNVYLLGGTVTRRVYGGCYNEVDAGFFTANWSTARVVTGNVNLYIGSGSSITLTYDDNDLSIYAHSRYGNVSGDSAEYSRLIFLDSTAYDNYKNKLEATDSGMKTLASWSDSMNTAADYICYLGTSASGNVITVGATEVEDNASNALDLTSATATVNVKQDSYEYRGEALTPATVTYSDNWAHGKVALTYANNNAGGTATATITTNGVSANQSFEIVDNSVTVVVNGESKLYYNLQDAFDAAGEGGLVKLTEDCAQNVTVNTNLYLDLAGSNLTGTVTVAEGMTLYGMDSTTDGYKCSDGYGKISAIVGNYAVHHKTEVDSKVGKILRYLAIVEDDGVSFHRFYLGIQKVTLKTSVTGFGYKAIFGGDEKVIAQLNETEAFGYNLWLEGSDSKTSAYAAKEKFVSGKVVSLRLENFDIENFGDVPVYATVYLKFGDEVITSAEYTYSMQQMLENINTNINQYDAAQIQAVQKMLENYTDTVSTWGIDALLSWKEEETV